MNPKYRLNREKIEENCKLKNGKLYYHSVVREYVPSCIINAGTNSKGTPFNVQYRVKIFS